MKVSTEVTNESAIRRWNSRRENYVTGNSELPTHTPDYLPNLVNTRKPLSPWDFERTTFVKES